MLRRFSWHTRRLTACNPGVPSRRSKSTASNSTFSKSCANRLLADEVVDCRDRLLGGRRECFIGQQQEPVALFAEERLARRIAGVANHATGAAETFNA